MQTTIESASGGGRSPLIALFLAAVAALAALLIALAAVPLTALERVFDLDEHWWRDELAMFVDGHRLDIVVAGVTTLLVAAVVVFPAVTG